MALHSSNLAGVSGQLIWTRFQSRAQPTMSENAFPSGQILTQFMRLVEGQARLEQKLDNFFTTQNDMKSEIEEMKSDISSVRADVAEIKAQRRTTKAYLAGIAAVAGGISWVASQFLDPVLKKLFGV